MLSRLALAGLTLCVLAGCHSCGPYYNSCGPGVGYPANTIYTPPTTVVPNNVQPSYPSGGAPAGVAPSGPGSNAPPYQPPTNGAANGGGRAVPNYDADPSLESEPNFNVSPEPLGATERPATVEMTDVNAVEEEIETEEIAADEFVEPIPFQPASVSGELDGPSTASMPSRPNPYMYDKNTDDFNGDGVEETYEWLRGVVNFNEKLRVWEITYNADPTDRDDKYGGTFTLSNDSGLYDLGVIPDDVVLIDGRVDIGNVDEKGKPTYRVENVKRLEPDQHAAGQ